MSNKDVDSYWNLNLFASITTLTDYNHLEQFFKSLQLFQQLLLSTGSSLNSSGTN
jgi:hypothetical protein